MHSVALPPPVVDLSARTQRAVDATARRSRQIERAQARSAAWFLAPGLPGLFVMGRLLARLIAELNSPGMDHLCEADLKRIAHESGQVHGRLVKILRVYEKYGISQSPVFRWVLNPLENRTSHLGSILEGLHLSLNPEFVQMISDSAQELRENKQQSRAGNHSCPSVK